MFDACGTYNSYPLSIKWVLLFNYDTCMYILYQDTSLIFIKKDY